MGGGKPGARFPGSVAGRGEVGCERGVVGRVGGGEVDRRSRGEPGDGGERIGEAVLVGHEDERRKRSATAFRTVAQIKTQIETQIEAASLLC